MHKFIMMVILAAVSSSAIAEWKWIGSAGNSALYVDPATIQKSGGIVKMWNLVDLKTAKTTSNGESYMSAKAQTEYDCIGMQSRLVGFSIHSGNMGAGNVIINKSGNGKWEPIPHDRNSLWKIACGKN